MFFHLINNKLGGDKRMWDNYLVRVEITHWFFSTIRKNQHHTLESLVRLFKAYIGVHVLESLMQFLKAHLGVHVLEPLMQFLKAHLGVHVVATCVLFRIVWGRWVVPLPGSAPLIYQLPGVIRRGFTLLDTCWARRFSVSDFLVWWRHIYFLATYLYS